MPRFSTHSADATPDKELVDFIVERSDGSRSFHWFSRVQPDGRMDVPIPYTHWLFVWPTEPSLKRLELGKEGVPIERESEIASNFLLFD